MQYRIDKKSGNQLSILGFGCMRFPRNLTQIDVGRTGQLILKAVEEGVNYYAASNCIACGACEKRCPQHIPITRSLKKVRKKMEPFWLRVALNVYLKIRAFK